VLAQLSNFTSINDGFPAKDTNTSGGAITWNNGTPTLSVTNTKTGLYFTGLENGFQVTAPADLARRRLKIYVWVYGAQGRFRASLSDVSAPPYDNSSLQNVFNVTSGIYTMDYAAASPGQVLTIKFTNADLHDALYGCVALEAATLAYISPLLRSGNPPWSANVFRLIFSVKPDAPTRLSFRRRLDPPIGARSRTSRATAHPPSSPILALVPPNVFIASEVRD